MQIVVTRGANATVGLAPHTVEGKVQRQTGTGAIHLPPSVSIQPGAGLQAAPSTVVNSSDGTFSFTIQATTGNGVIPTQLSFSKSDGGVVQTSFDLTADTVGPQVSVAVLPSSATGRNSAWAVGSATAATFRRDETATIRVVGQEALTGVSIQVGDAGSLTSSPTGCGCASEPACLCFVAPLWEPGLALQETLEIKVNGTDVRNVPLTAKSIDGGRPEVEVTRLRWRVLTSSSQFEIRAAPVLDDDGTVFVGNRAGSSGWVYAFDPAGVARSGWDGGVAIGAVTSLAFWRRDAGSADDVLYFNANTAGGGMLGAVGASGSVLSGGCTSTQATNMALALAEEGSSLSAIAHYSFVSSTGAACMWNPAVGTARTPAVLPDDQAVAAPVPSDTQGIQNLIVSKRVNESVATLLAVVRTSTGLTLTRRSIASPNAFVGEASYSPLIGSTQAASSNGVAYTGGVSMSSFGNYALSAGASPGGLWAVPSGTSRLSAEPVSPAVVGRGGFVFAHGGSSLIRTDFGGGMDSTATFPGPVVASPVLTQNSAGQPDRLFLVSSSGRLGSLKLSSPTAMEWEANLPGLSQVSASLGFDCNRLASGTARSATGVVYVASGNGYLMSVIVDSPKLDTQAPWPKYQRDAFNSGNTFLSFDNCP
ncbi:MAG: PQQ-binding-like beta-propeller repeat protein [Myxococcota bacterium]